MQKIIQNFIYLQIWGVAVCVVEEATGKLRSKQNK